MAVFVTVIGLSRRGGSPGRLGAEVGGVDLSRPVGDDVLAEIRAALLENLVIFFRDQDSRLAHNADILASVRTVQPPKDVQTTSTHPLVRTHPETGRKSLYIGGHVHYLEAMTEEESRPLIGYLYKHATQPAFTSRFRWEKGSLVFWDNRCTQHFAINDCPAETRIMHRVTIRGDKPF